MVLHSTGLRARRNARTRVTLSAPTAKNILEACQFAQPQEACGLLVGFKEIQQISVVRAVAVPNVCSHEPQTQFRIDPKEQFALQRQLRAEGSGLSLVGHFHSHPGGKRVPSERDIENVTDPEALWVIVGGDMAHPDDIAAFMPTTEGFEPVDLLTAEPVQVTPLNSKLM